MSRLSLESLETRETPASAHPDLYLNIWINQADARPVEEVAFVYRKIDVHADGDISVKGSKILANSPVAKDETITIDQNHTETAAVRHRTFAVVDRTTMAHDSVWIDLGTPAANGGAWKTKDGGASW
jgi:hypothetical protein